MGVYPKEYSKNEFIAFLHKNNVSDKVIEKFNELPETIIYKNSEYKLNINSTWYSGGQTHYSFEFNYYSENLVEYRFSPKVFNDIEKSINYLLCELINNGYIVKEEKCNQ
jgi:hypothetical protein